jgi:membrane protein DedA with SNARE-associated domain
VTLLATGLLVASGAVSPYLALPLVWLACGSGAWLGFTWARRLGRHGLEGVAGRIGAEGALRRAGDRLGNAGPRTIGVSRSIPGLRVYTSLVAGAVGVRDRTFLAGAIPAMMAWATLWTLLGATVGIPAEHLFGDVQKLALRAAVLLAVGILGFVAARRIPPSARAEQLAAGMAPRPGRIVLAIAIDLGIVGSLVAGSGAVARTFLAATTRFSWAEVTAIVALVGLAYLVAARRSAGATAGESMLSVSYVRRVRREPDATAAG